MEKYRIQHNYTDIFISSFSSKEKIKNSNVLDIGCGDGYAANKFLTLGAKNVYAVDLNLEKEILINPDKILYCSDMKELPDIKYDIIWAHHVIEHVETPTDFLRTIYEKLKDDGELWLACPNAEHKVYSPGHINNYILPNLLEQTRRAGFKIKNSSWWFRGCQLRIRVYKACIDKKWPEPCQVLLNTTKRIDLKKLPEKWNW